MRKMVVLLLAAWMLAAVSASACELCGSMAQRTSLTHEFSQAQVIVYGHLANPMFTNKAGSGTTEFHFDQIIKDDPALPRQKMMLVSRYLPILDPKSPPKYVMFFRSTKQGLQLASGKEVANKAALDFVAELHRLREEPGKMMVHAAKHFDHADPLIADEAFMLFAKADDKLIAEHAAKLSPVNLRKLVKDPDMESERLSLFAYLLGACGNSDDADLLGSLAKNPQPRHYKAFEGILAGYITIRPKDGWATAQQLLHNDKQNFLLRYATLRTLRFYYNANPKEHGPQVMQGLASAIGHPDIADIAIEDMRRWKRWEHTKLVLSCWDKKSHQSPITRQSVVRFALACQEPDARAFLERARQQDPELVKRMEEELK